MNKQKILSGLLLAVIALVFIRGLTRPEEQTRTVIFQHENGEDIVEHIAAIYDDPEIKLIGEPEVIRKGGITWVSIRYVEK